MVSEDSFMFAKGQDWAIDWTIRDADADTADPVNIAGWTFAFKVKRQDADPDPSLVTASISIVDAAAGQVRTTGTAAELDNLIGDYRFALWRTNAGAKVPLRTGYFSVVDTVQS